MHSATVITQRAQSATRAKTRWQPYTSTPATTAAHLSRSPSSLYLPTPINSSVASPNPTVNATCDPPRPRQTQPPHPSTSSAQTPKEPVQRDGSKHKFAVGLIDQAVKTLSDLWRPQDIPHVFLAPQKGATIHPTNSTTLASQVQQHLPSKLTHISSLDSPSTQPTSPPAVTSQRPPQVLIASDSESDLLPLRSFVHEVLKRSRTSGSILQTALCYLEAVRPKITEIRRDEKLGIRNYFQPETRILPATEEELVREAELALEEASSDFTCSDDSMKTVRITDQDEDDQDAMLDAETQSNSSLIVEPSIASGTSSSSSLPSPLLCPRRAFLASLILASKFSQDKCYSNRAWAKLSSLPPREIGRCERALGQALDWRLWVGKVASASPTPAPPIRTVVRTQSESSIGSPSTSRAPFLVPQDSPAPLPVAPQQDVLTAPAPLSGSNTKRLRKSSTLPAGSFTFAASRQAPTSSGAAPAFDIGVSYCEGTGISASALAKIGSDMDIGDDADVFDTRRQDLQSTKWCETSSHQTSSSGPTTPSPDTPSLTYSPSSTDSAGDRTIQMSSFEDGFPAYPSSQPWIDITLTASSSSCSLSSSDQRNGLLGAPPVGQTAWPASILMPIPFASERVLKEKAYLSHGASGFAFDLAMAAHMQARRGFREPMISVVADAEAVPPFGSSRLGHYLWHADSGITVEPTGVH